jgi:hypothetical protein
MGGPVKSANPGVQGWIESSLSSSPGHIRQFAFDGDPASYFLSSENPSSRDHFTLFLEKPVALTSVEVHSGRAAGEGGLDAGLLEGSADGKAFQVLARFEKGVARAKAERIPIQALRIRVEQDLDHPLAVREIALACDPPVEVFKYPVEVSLDLEEAPEMADWAKKTARTCERAYGMINEELRSDGYRPRTEIRMSLKPGYSGVAETSGGHITGSVSYFRRHPDDVGAMIHETVHVVQHYRGGGPGWLVEGIADYVRFFKYEPGKMKPPRADRARYDGSYQTSAAFLGYLVEKYDREIVRKLNERLRKGQYQEEAFRELTGKPVAELGDEWRQTLSK